MKAIKDLNIWGEGRGGGGRILKSYASPELRLGFAYGCLEFSEPITCLDEAT